MSTLQWSLAIIGGLVLAVLVAYNAWTLRRNAPRRAQTPPDADKDPPPRATPVDFAADFAADSGAMGNEGTEQGAALAGEPDLRLEPVFDAALAPADFHHGLEHGPDPASHSVDVRDALAEPVRPVPAPIPPGLVAESRFALDALIDAIAPLQPEHEVTGEAALAAMPPTRRAGSKPFAIEGLNAATGLWERPAPGQRYQRFQAGVQLANRLGALNDIEFSEFVAKTQVFSDAVSAMPDFPDMRHEVARARELDQFAVEHDAQLAFALRARSTAWSPGYVEQNAVHLGFVPSAMPGRMLLPAAPGLPPLLTLGFDMQAAQAEDLDQSALWELTLSLDVPQVAPAQQPFARLREVATALCEAMDGVLCDQEGHPLPTMALDAIAADLEALYAQLAARDLAAGSALARRLFS
ncbi:cell division protein FtsZ [Extensimonas sp. H3M7-6]|uniref:cell division protein FtsZ n=1 Tax=Extensimonas soli TaxID=3031322 RepID=UPI0023DAB86C|nr:cell division protein FtsZ [Extensimonas sp. H3M7-6]MDF1483171.1 cell division protein FtsZ [Extensimonas sp. H3M7-6]